MNISDYDLLNQTQKIEINKFIEENIETIFDKRKSYKTYVNSNIKHLEVNYHSDTEELVDTDFVGYFCNNCHDWVKGTSDISLVEHVLEHLNNINTNEIEI